MSAVGITHPLKALLKSDNFYYLQMFLHIYACEYRVKFATIPWNRLCNTDDIFSKNQERFFYSGEQQFNTYTAKPVCWNGWISDSYCSLKPLCSGMGEVVPAHTSPTLLPPSPRTVLSLSCFKVSQCINCRD